MALVKEFGWRCYYGDATRLDLLKEAGIAEAKLLVIAINDPVATLGVANLVHDRWPNVEIIVRARSRTDAFDLRDLGLDPIRETFYSSLKAAKSALQFIGESPSSASKIIKHFEISDLEQLETSRKIRDDIYAVVSVAKKGHQDLKNLLELEQIKIESKKIN